MDIEFKNCVFDSIKDCPKIATDISKAIENVLESNNVEAIGLKISGQFKGNYEGKVNEYIPYAKIDLDA